MSFTAKVVDGLLAVFNGRPDAIEKYPDVYAYLKDWVMDGGNEVCGALIRSQLFVNKTETETLIIFMNAGGSIGWLLGKEAKREEWEKQFPGAKEKVWVVPDKSPVLHSTTDVKSILDYMRVWLKNHPQPAKVVVPPPDPTPLVVPTQDGRPLVDNTNTVTPITGLAAVVEKYVETTISEEKETKLLAAAAEELRLKELGVKPA